jgi:hypothetical protein
VAAVTKTHRRAWQRLFNCSLLLQERIRQGKEAQKKLDEYEWGTGSVQKEQVGDGYLTAL